MARDSRFKKRENVSSNHMKMRELLEANFPLFNAYEEYQYDLILKRGYKMQKTPAEFHDAFLLKRGRSLHADFCLLDLGVIIEIQGEHHFEPVFYDKTDPDKALSDFEARKNLDKVKRMMAKEAGFNLIEWPHWEPIEIEALLDKLG